MGERNDESVKGRDQARKEKWIRRSSCENCGQEIVIATNDTFSSSSTSLSLHLQKYSPIYTHCPRIAKWYEVE